MNTDMNTDLRKKAKKYTEKDSFQITFEKFHRVIINLIKMFGENEY